MAKRGNAHVEEIRMQVALVFDVGGTGNLTFYPTRVMIDLTQPPISPVLLTLREADELGQLLQRIAKAQPGIREGFPAATVGKATEGTNGT